MFSFQTIKMIDITTYRARIGTFAGGTSWTTKLQRSMRMEKTPNGKTTIDTDIVVYMTLVSLLVVILQIRTHLLLSGDVELNPGPVQQTNKTSPVPKGNIITEGY